MGESTIPLSRRTLMKAGGAGLALGGLASVAGCSKGSGSG